MVNVLIPTTLRSFTVNESEIELSGSNVSEVLDALIEKYPDVKKAIFDKDGNRLDVAIQNIYVNSSAALNPGAERQSGSGKYVIVELEGGDSAEVAGVIQRTTLRTDTLIASPSPWMHE